MGKISISLMLFLFSIVNIQGSTDIPWKDQKLSEDQKQVILQKPEDMQFQALEKALDPDTYIVGPGDVFTLNIWGLEDQSLTLAVSPEGLFVIPGAGEIKVDGKPLSEAKYIINRELSKVFLNSNFSVYLVKLRRFQVSVSGAVMLPGNYITTAANRVHDAILLAGGFFQEEKDPPQTIVENVNKEEKKDKVVEEKNSCASLRNLHVIRKDGSFLRVDLMRFRELADNSLNPSLMDGDRIYVPFIDPSIGSINVFGAVNKPGDFEFIEGDRLLDLIDLAHGTMEDADQRKIEVARFIEDGSTTLFSLDLTSPTEKYFPLKQDDRIFVRSLPDYHQKKQATIVGEVKVPGTYMILENKTMLSELVEKAGGVTQWASLEEARLIREQGEEKTDPEFERLKLVNSRDMSKTEYSYFKYRSQMPLQIASVDFVKLFAENDSTHDIPLRDGDIIEIPRLKNIVMIMGAVHSPGEVPYEKGQNVDFYIKKAGDFSWNARKGQTRLINATTGDRIKVSGKEMVGVGDTIFVPDKPEKDYWALVKDIIQVSSQVATLILVIQNMTQ